MRHDGASSVRTGSGTWLRQVCRLPPVTAPRRARAGAASARSQFHWCGYSVRDGSVEAPSQLASSTARASVSSRARRLSVAGLAFDVTEWPPTSTVRGRRNHIPRSWPGQRRSSSRDVVHVVGSPRSTLATLGRWLTYPAQPAQAFAGSPATRTTRSRQCRVNPRSTTCGDGSTRPDTRASSRAASAIIHEEDVANLVQPCHRRRRPASGAPRDLRRPRPRRIRPRADARAGRIGHRGAPVGARYAAADRGMKALVLHGVNLDMFGKRDPAHVRDDHAGRDRCPTHGARA